MASDIARVKLENIQTSQSEYDVEKFSEFDFVNSPHEILTHKYLNSLERNQKLEAALKVMENKTQQLEARNAELKDELKRMEIMRLSQLELLALRNVELEKILDDAGIQVSPERPRTLAVPAWASWGGKSLCQPIPRSLSSSDEDSRR